jgi:hypothetical protein
MSTLNPTIKTHIRKCVKGNHNVFTVLNSIQQHFDLTRGEATDYTPYINQQFDKKREAELWKPFYAGRNLRYQ